MKKWKTYNSSIANQSFDAIIIGSGIGGLCTAALLGLKGKRVLVLEKHFKIGGWTHTFRRDNYEWDVGIHYIGQVHKSYSVVRKLFDIISDGKLKWSPMDKNYDRIIFPDQSYDFVAPREQFIDDMIGYFPREEAAIMMYMDLLNKAVNSSRSYFSNKALSGFLGSVTYPFMTRKFFKYSDSTTLDVLSSLTQDPKLIGVLTGQWGDYGLPPAQSSFAMHAFVAQHYLDGGNYPTGSSRMIAETISDLIEKNNGVLAVNAGVKEIKLHRGAAVGVIMENGDSIESKNIISNAGVANTLNVLLGNDNNIPPNMNNNLKSIEQTKSYVCLHMGLNKSANDLGLSNTNLWIYPDYDHDKAVKKYIENPEADFPVVYVSFPSAKDGAWDEKHPNSATMEAITLSRWNWYKKWEHLEWKKRGEEYEAEKGKLSERILDIVFKHVKGIEASLDYKELSTPLTVRDLANYQKGEMYGIDHSPQRFRQRWLRPQSDIKNLYFTGQDVTTVGVSSAIFSGLLTASAVLKENLSKMLKK
jgi:all-trans-retinol 13,14-reductase